METTTFARDYRDREVIALAILGWGKGLLGETLCEMLIEAVEKRFGSVGAVPVGYPAGIPQRQRQRLHR